MLIAASLADPDPVLPVRPYEPDDADCESGSDDDVEFVEILTHRAPVLAEFHPKPR